MPTYYNTAGHTVPASEALIGTMLRDGFRMTMSPGESLAFDINLVDGAPRTSRVFLMDNDDAPASIDAAVKEAILAVAKSSNMKPSEYLAVIEPKKLGELLASVVQRHVQTAGGAGIARAFSMDAAAAAIADARAARCARVENAHRAGRPGPVSDAGKLSAPAVTSSTAAVAAARAAWLADKQNAHRSGREA